MSYRYYLKDGTVGFSYTEVKDALAKAEAVDTELTNVIEDAEAFPLLPANVKSALTEAAKFLALVQPILTAL